MSGVILVGCPYMVEYAFLKQACGYNYFYDYIVSFESKTRFISPLLMKRAVFDYKWTLIHL